MKKRLVTLLALLLLAILALTALAACENEPETPVESKKVTVTFMAGDKVFSKTEIEAGTTVAEPTTEPTAPEDDEVFRGWRVNGTAWDFTTPVTEDLTLTAAFGPIPYTITFDAKGGSEVAPVEVDPDTAAVEPTAPTRTGYEFVGWYLDGLPYDFDTLVRKDITLTAKWTVKMYTVTYDSNGGTDVTPSSVTHNRRLSAPAAPTRVGYDFAGWYHGDVAYDFDTAVLADFTLVAHWTIKRYDITFDANGGTAVAPANVEHGQTVATPDDPTREGYDFTGWTLSDTAYDFSAPVTSEITLVAQWTIKHYTVIFLAADGTLLSTETVDHGHAATPPTPPEGSATEIFAGWDRDISSVTDNMTVTATYSRRLTVTFKNEAGATLATVYAPEGQAVTLPTLTPPDGYELDQYLVGGAAYDIKTPLTADLTIVVRWKIKVYTVTFDSAGGTDVADASVNHGDTVAMPAAPSREGYDFAGWYLGETEYNFATPVKDNVTLVAHWTIKTYTYTFVDEDGDELGTATADHGETIQVPTLTPLEGYRFDAYLVDGEVYDITTPAAGSLTIVVRWAIKVYTVTFDPAGGTDVADASVDHGSAAVAPKAPTRDYYNFDGWYLGTEPYDFETPVTTDLTLTAKWRVIAYRVDFDTTGGTLLPEIVVNAGTKLVLATTPVKTGFTLVGWQTEDGKMWDMNAPVTAAMTLTAVWSGAPEAPAPTVSGIYFDPGELEMWQGMSLKLGVQPFNVSADAGSFSFLTAAGITMEFHSLDTGVATVAEDGTITSVALGTTEVYAVFKTGGTINNGKEDVTIKAGDISNAVTVRVVDKPDYLKAYEKDPVGQKITLGDTATTTADAFLSLPTGAYGSANIAAWYGGASSVFTLTADDNLMNDFAQWAAWYQAYGVPTTLCAPTRTPYEAMDLWREMVALGLDVQSHSHFHRSSGVYSWNNGTKTTTRTSSAQDWMDFYAGQQDILSSGIRSLIIAYPCGYNNAAYSSLLYIAGRGTSGASNSFHVNYNNVNSFSGLDGRGITALRDLVEKENGGWLSTHYHSIGSGKDTLDGYLSELVPYLSSGKLWAATFAAAAQYGQERDTATLTMGTLGTDLITFTLTDQMNDLLFDQALTVRIKVDATWQNARAYQNGQLCQAKVVTEGGETYLYVDAIPDRGEVSVVRTAIEGLTLGETQITFTPTEAGADFTRREMTLRLAVSGNADAWAHVLATQNGARIEATSVIAAGQRYVDVTCKVGGGAVTIVPAGDAFASAESYTMTDVFGGAVAPSAGVPITIASAEELRMFARYVNAGNGCEGLTFLLTRDIDLEGEAFDPIGWYFVANSSSSLQFDRAFHGTFDGQGHTISRLTIRHEGCASGLFGATDGATVKNLKVLGAEVFGIRHTGGVIGRMVGGTLENCTFTGTVMSRGIGAANYTGAYVGGLVGQISDGAVRHCAVEADILVFGARNRGADNYGDVYTNQWKAYVNGSYVGGAIGYISTEGAADTAEISNVSFVGTVTGVADNGESADMVGGFIGGGTLAKVTDCSSTATVVGRYQVGGFVGSYAGVNQVFTIRNCVANGTVTGEEQVGGFAGYMGTTARASFENVLVNVTVNAPADAASVGAVIGLAESGPQSPKATNVYYIPTLNEGMVTHTAKNGNVKVSLTFKEAASAAAVLDTLNELATTAGDQSWLASGTSITPVHYPIWRVVFVGKDGATLATHDVPNGLGVTPPAAPSLLGYRFTGWSADTSTVAGDMTVTAEYETVVVRTVIFLDKDGEEISRVEVNDGASVTPPAAPSYEGFRFTGWSAATDAVTADMTVTAQYETVDIHTVTFVKMDGKTVIAAVRVNDGEGATAPSAPAVDGYVFTGWSTTFDEVHGDLTVTAQYARLWTVRFYGKDGALLGSDIVRDGYAATAPTAPALDGYIFSGWSVDITKITADTDVTTVYLAKSTDPITVTISHQSIQNGHTLDKIKGELSGDICFLDSVKASAVPSDMATSWGYEREMAMGGSNAGTGYGIAYNLTRFSLADGMKPLSIASTATGINGLTPQQEYVVSSSVGSNGQVLAVPLFDKTTNRIVVAVLAYYGVNNHTDNLDTFWDAVVDILLEKYTSADAFVISMNCRSGPKKGGHTGHKTTLSTMDDTTPFATGWNVECIAETDAPDGGSTYYTMTLTQTGETGTLNGSITVIPTTDKVTSGGVSASVTMGKKKDET